MYRSNIREGIGRINRIFDGSGFIYTLLPLLWLLNIRLRMDSDCLKGSSGLSCSLKHAVSELLDKTTCGSLVTGQHVVVIPADMDVTSACQMLVKHEISSAPVYDAASENYLGMLDFRDLVDYILIVCQNQGPDDNLFQNDPTQALEWEIILQQSIAGRPISARLATDLSRKNPFYSVIPESSLRVAIDVMKSGIHRLNVMNESSQIVGVLSQTDILRFIASKPEIMTVLDKYTLKQLDIHQTPAICAHGDELLHTALARMRQHGISSIAVTSHTDSLIGNISMADIKYIFKHAKLSTLWKSCASFVRRVLSEDGLERGKDRYPYFDVTLSSTLSMTIRKLLATKTHRIWIVSPEDEGRRVIGVVSLTDILNLFYAPDSDTR
jgi:CBS domain-containing protein